MNTKKFRSAGFVSSLLLALFIFTGNITSSLAESADSVNSANSANLTANNTNNKSGSVSTFTGLFYLSADGFLVELDPESVKEMGKVVAGQSPNSITKCGNEIVFTDMGKDTIYAYNPNTGALRKSELIDVQNFSNEFVVYENKKAEVPKSPLRKATETLVTKNFNKKKKEQKEKASTVIDDLPALAHNKKLGIGSVTCSEKYIFVASALKKRVEVLSRKDLSRVARLVVGERPLGLSVSPDGKYLAIASTAADTLTVVNISSNNFAKSTEFEIKNGPTDVAWLDSGTLVCLSRGNQTLSLVRVSEKQVSKSVQFPVLVNSLLVNPDAPDKTGNSIYVISGEKKVIFIISNELTFEQAPLEEAMHFASNAIAMKDGKLLIASEKDSKVIIFNPITRQVEKRIMTNLTPKAFVQY